ncbi:MULTISPECIES: chemotaxis protein CheB [unclassified Janthinobacterium]|uniref:chemotaxis protein CheB n=1 Tax=unclassified Janthinobacterium TaxID=2610881 RepID=UPI0017F95C94|nr:MULTISPECIES: chemotaxis protein CheB [unclassified Janthinobacterium]MBB5366980.1 two-component system CheB/CheR fusion protein [Janthinobacterium sp. K2C7]MBB5380542.1 two-component system CheB/CheR fusion protein [Janthinobacterium sp. K2Li3]MBB5385362.1 two-component system CheB/CheR fusion protein [Janthinobacterium sp. K2E3]
MMTRSKHSTASTTEAAPIIFPVVAIGASAGGLDPIVAFLANVPQESGIAYVVIQHLDPTQKAMLPELLQRATSIPVMEITHHMEMRPNHIYVIPSNADLTLFNGCFVLSEPVQLRGHRLPINIFFESLAAEWGKLTVGVIFSGMGSDGTRGLQAIKRAGGLTLAQHPDTAKFDMMPQSAISAALVDLIDFPDKMPEKIVAYLLRSSFLRSPGSGPNGRNTLQEVVALLSEHTGNSFTDYKINTVLRRIERRMSLHQMGVMEEYVVYLRSNPAEIDLLFKELLIGVTSFFRDQKVWEYLKTVALPQLLEAHPDGRAFKAWVPACSTGEEAYSLAMVFHEVVASINPPSKYSLQIFATDLSGDAIDRARQGRFPETISSDVSAERLERFFMAGKREYHVKKEIRNMIIFAQQNIISDPPFTKLDILCCRNLLIYLNAKLQQRLIPLFHYALNRDGLLLLGTADTPGHFSELFAPLITSSRLYRRLDNLARQRLPTYFPTKVSLVSPPIPSDTREASMPGKIQSHVEQLLLQKYSPAAALLNQDGDILYINGRTGAFLEPAAGKANWNIHAMAREGLRYELAGLIKQALQSDGVVRLKGLVVKDHLGQSLGVDVSAEALSQPDSLRGMVFVTFSSMTLVAEPRRIRSPNPKVLELEQQLTQARNEIQAVRDEMQTSREELKSANEELQSTNEELQSTNEELTTSKEEMQSLNEELYTVNAELQSKVDDLSLVNSDMKNLLNSTDIATIFLDSALRIRRFTAPATQIYKLIQTDLRRPLSDIVNDLDYPELENDALEVIRSLVFSEKHVSTKTGRWYDVRIMPYRTIENVIDGVIVTFINITESKLLEAQLRQMQSDVVMGGETGESVS